MNIRKLFAIALTLVGSAFAHTFVYAQGTYPTKPIKFIVPYPAGGPLDTVARLTGQKLSERLGQPVIVENKPGAGGNLGADFVAKSAPDGYTILMGGCHSRDQPDALQENAL